MGQILGPFWSLTIFFFISIPIQWKIHFDAIQFIVNRFQQKFLHAMTDMLVCHEQNSVAIPSVEFEWELKFPSNLNCDGNIVSETGPWSRTGPMMALSVKY